MNKLDDALRAGLLPALLAAALAAGGCGSAEQSTSAEVVDEVSQAATTCLTISRLNGYSIQDTWVESPNPNLNHGTALGLRVAARAGGAMTTLYQFDLSMIPSDAIIVSADANLYQISNPVTQPMMGYLVTAPWTEMGATWNNIGTSVASTPFVSLTATASPTPIPQSFSITSLVQSWVDGSVPNNGFMLAVPAPAPPGSISMAGSEEGIFKQPKFVVCYDLPCGGACDDGDPCTVDTCGGALGCQFDPGTGMACDDGDPNTVGDVCTAGVCGGVSGAQPNGGACTDDAGCLSGSCTCGYCGEVPAWTPMSTVGQPSPRSLHTSIWTGSKMVVWGGQNSNSCLTSYNDGASYDPVTNTWTPISNVNAPPPRARHTAIWTGAPLNKMIVWGGQSSCDQTTSVDTGGIYDPATDTWTPTSVVGAPLGRTLHGAVWTGTEMLIQSGKGVNHLFQSDGRLYNPVTDTWRTISSVGDPGKRSALIVGLMGNVVLNFGGFVVGHGIPLEGGLYDLSTDTWAPLPFGNPPVPRMRLTPDKQAIWTGSELIMWGGTLDFTTHVATDEGSIYNPVTGTWRTMSTVNVPTARDFNPSVWTGNHMLIWGGAPGTGLPFNDGGLYNPVADAWCPTLQTGAPRASLAPTGAWTGSTGPMPNRLIVWGGKQTQCGPSCNIGAIYTPGGV